MKYVLFTILCFGVTPVLDKWSAVQSDPAVGVFIRTLCIAVVSVLILTVTGKWGLVTQVAPKTILFLGTSGILAGCLGVLAMLKAFREVPDAGKVAVMIATYPVVSLFFTALLLHEKLTVAKIAGTVLITAGAILLNL
ncbi:MAG TPA: EamA family transporter [Candidatus Ozemobacteraceae bacterium]|nr:EamA family transporter [Candidatus Ozemobacteraceae bacterium]